MSEPLPEPAERALLEALSRRLRDEDRAVRSDAAKLLFERFRDPLRRHIRCELARLHKRTEQPPEDAFQSGVETHVNSTLLKLLERLDKGPLGDRDDLHFLAYLKAMVRNALMTRRRREQRSRFEPDELLDRLQRTEPSIVDQLGEQEQRAQEEQALAERRSRLSSEDQRLFDMYRAGLSHRQIAQQLGGSPGQYRARMGRILRKLR